MRLFLTAFSALIGTVLLVGCDDGEGGGQSAAKPPAVTVAGVAKRDIAESSRFVGKIEAVDSADLIARVDGFLAEVAVRDGAYVQEGDVLFRIERERYDADLAGARAALAQAEADLALAEIELERNERLLASDTVAQSQYDAALAQRDAGKARGDAAEAGVRQAELNVGYTEIRAPFEGRIGRIAFSAGDVVGPSKGPIATLVKVAPVYAAFSLNEGDFLDALARHGGNIRDGIDPANSPPVTLTLPNGEAFGETGRVVFIDNRIDPATGTIGLRAEFDNASGVLAPGIFVTVEITAKEAQTRLVVPQAAIQRDQKGPFALVVGSEGTVEQRYVGLGPQTGTDFVVDDGLQEGESVIVEGLQRVRPGVPVEAVRAGAEG